MSKRRDSPIFRLLIIPALSAAMGPCHSYLRGRGVLQLSNYQLKHFAILSLVPASAGLGFSLPAMPTVASRPARQDVAATSASVNSKDLGLDRLC